MISGRQRRSWGRWAAVLVPYALLAWFVPLTPETPYGDDFDYAATAWHLAETGVLRMSDWPTTMLAGHAVWGALFCKVGGNSYAMLRLSMFALSAAIALALVSWARRQGHSMAFAAWCGLTFALNPLTVSLEYSFLTDITGAALGVLLVLVGSDFAREQRPRAWFGFGVLGAFAYLSRQTAAIPFVFTAALTFWQVWQGTASRRKLAIMLAPFVVTVVGFRYWLTWSHGVPENFNFQFLRIEGLAHHAERLSTVALGLGLQLAPVAVLVAVAGWRSVRGWPWKILGAGAVLAVLVAGVMSPVWPTLYQGEVFDFGLHALEFPAGDIPEVLRGPEWIVSGRRLSVFRSAALVVATLSTAVLIVGCFRRAPGSTGRSALPLPTLATLTFLADAGLLMFTWVYVDRYLVALVPLAIIVLAERLPPERAARGVAPALAWLATGVMGCLSVVGIQDGMQRSTVYWDTARQLHAMDVDPQQVDAGLAYGGFYRYNPTYRGPNHVGPYLQQLPDVQKQYMLATYSPLTLIADRPVCISFSEREGYSVAARAPFVSWFRRGDVLVLVRNGVSPAGLPRPFLQWVESGGRIPEGR